MKALKKIGFFSFLLVCLAGWLGLDSINEKYMQPTEENVIVSVMENGAQQLVDIVIPSAKAQCVPSPRIMGQGPQGGSPCWGGNNSGNQGNQFVIPQGIQVGQPFSTNINGQNMRCTWKDRVATAAVDGLAGAAIAGAVARVAKMFKANVSANDAAIAGALAGAGAGATFLCEPDMVDDNDAVRQVQVASAQQTARKHPCDNPAEIPLKLNLPSHKRHGDIVCMRPDDPNRARD